MDKELTLIEHLEELRRRIIVSLILLAAITAAAFPFAGGFLTLLKKASLGSIDKLVFFNPQDAFLIHIKISFFVSLTLSMPVILYQLWAFISPAIEDRTKKRGLAFLIFSIGAFALGAAFAFFILVPAAIKFLLSFSGESLEPMISASGYVSFALTAVLGCGLVFEMPVLSYLLSAIGIVDHRFLRKIRKYAVIVIFITAAIVTPTPDAFNMTILAIPMLFLYEVSIWVSRFGRGKE